MPYAGLWSLMLPDPPAIAKIVGIGGALFFIVSRFFFALEHRLSEGTTERIDRWLRLKHGETAAQNATDNWPETFSTVVDELFGKRLLSLRGFVRSCSATCACLAIGILLSATHSDFSFVPWGTIGGVVYVSALALPLLVIPDYLSLVKNRMLIRVPCREPEVHGRTIIGLDLTVALALLLLTLSVGSWIGPSSEHNSVVAYIKYVSFVWRAPAYWSMALVPAILFPSIWLWLYAGSGFLLKAAHRCGIRFEYFNRLFDLEKKPLRSIGLVAGGLVASVYWTAVVVVLVLG